MHPCRDSQDGGGSALHIVTLWFDPGYEGAAPGRGKRLAGRLLHTDPAATPTLLREMTLLRVSARDVNLLGIK